MTDNEIIKALEDCFDKNEIVVSVYEPNDTKTDVTIQDVLDLINRQKAYIERLTASVERLADESDARDIDEYNMVCKVRADAIKEFAGRVKADTIEFGAAKGVQRVVDNLVKEMVGDTE